MPAWAKVLFILAGLFSIAGGLFDWEWFMTNYRAAAFVRLIGRTGTRILYIVLGLILAGLGFAGVFGLI